MRKLFFANNRKDIEELIKRYEQYKAGILQDQIDKIFLLKETMKNLTKVSWWDWHGWDLGVTFNEKSNRIGIESHFEKREEIHLPCSMPVLQLGVNLNGYRIKKPY